MKRFNCAKAGCEICSKATVVKGIFGIKRYKCSNYYSNTHIKIKAKDCLAFRCKCPTNAKECIYCRKGEKRR